jgi:hypothetical protein
LTSRTGRCGPEPTRRSGLLGCTSVHLGIFRSSRVIALCHIVSSRQTRRHCTVPYCQLYAVDRAITSVIEMTRSASVSRLASEFDNFLFAPIGEDRNEVPLSVLSALARLDVDPWHEAANLARLPKETATQRLASLIAGLPDASWRALDHGMIAARLIALLPRRAGISPRATLPGVGVVTESRAATHGVSFAIVMTLALSALCMIASRQPPAQVDNAHAEVTTTRLL